MRTCQSCGKENPADQDFCSCGEYLRWEPTGLHAGDHPGDGRRGQATPSPRPPPPLRRRPVTPAAPVAPETPATATATATAQPAAPPPPPPPPPPRTRSLAARRAGAAAAPVPESRPVAKTMVRGAVPAAAAVAGRRATTSAEPATIVLRAARRRAGQGRGARTTPSSPARRERVLRAGPQPERDRRQLRPARRGHAGGLVVDPPRHGLPGAVRLGRDLRAGGRGPPAPAAHPDRRGARVGAEGRRGLQGEPDRRRVRAAGAAHRPYIDTATALRPQRRRGRRKATYDVT